MRTLVKKRPSTAHGIGFGIAAQRRRAPAGSIPASITSVGAGQYRIRAVRSATSKQDRRVGLLQRTMGSEQIRWLGDIPCVYTVSLTVCLKCEIPACCARKTHRQWQFSVQNERSSRLFVPVPNIQCVKGGANPRDVLFELGQAAA